MPNIPKLLPRGLRARFLTAHFLALLSSSLVLAVLLWMQVRTTLIAELEMRGQARTQALALKGREVLLSADPGALAAEASRLVSEGEAAFVIVQDDAGQVVAQAAAPELDLGLIRSYVVADDWNADSPRAWRLSDEVGARLLSFSVPIRERGINGDPSVTGPLEVVQPPRIGTARIGIAADRTLGQIARALWIGLASGGLVSVLSIGAMLAMIRWTLRPLGAMGAAARSISHGDLTRRVEVESADEVGLLAESFNEMTASLEQSRRELDERERELKQIAAERESLLRSAERRAKRLEVLNDLSRAMASTLDPAEIHRHVHEQLQRLLHYDSLQVHRVLKDGFRQQFGWSRDGLASGHEDRRRRHEVDGAPTESELELISWLEQFADGFGPTAWACTPDGCTACSSDQQLEVPSNIEAGLQKWVRGQGLESVLVTRIVTNDQLLGVLVLGFAEDRAFAEEDRQLVVVIADNLAVVLKNADLYQELDQSYQQLKETQGKLARAEEARKIDRLRTVGQMASGIAHNFNNVMSSIIGRVQLLKIRADRGMLDEESVRKSLDVIEQAGLDGAETVRRIQEFSRGVDDEKMVLTDLNELMRGVAEITRPRWKDQAQSAGVQIELDLDLEPLPAVSCVPSEIREVMTNLIFNAVDAMPEGGTLQIRTETSDGKARILVRDTGVGMTASVAERIFDPFFSTKGVKGTGLGLSTCYGIVKRHGGDIRVASALSEGSCFSIEIPFANRNGKQRGEEQMMSGRPWRVLVADDEANVREVLVELLMLLGHEVVQATGGREAIREFGDHEFDLVLSDLGMPDLSGWDVVREIRGQDAEVPIVLATGWGAEIDAQTADQRGVTRVLAKPFTVQKVSSLIAELQAEQSSESKKERAA